VATWDDIRTVALALPGVDETDFRGEPWFTVGSRGFVQGWRGRVVMKLDKGHQELLFEARPDVFSPMNAGGLRWAWVEIDALDPLEVVALVTEAWRQVAPRRLKGPIAPAGG
jgi:hypothetical protein